MTVNNKTGPRHNGRVTTAKKPAPRLLRVLVQPVYVVEQDGELVEVNVQAQSLSAAQWKALNPETWAKEGAAAVEAQLGSGPQAED